MTRNQILAVAAVVAAAAGVWFFIIRKKDEESAPSVGPAAGDGGVVPSFGGGMSTFAATQPNDVNPGPGRKPSQPFFGKKGVNGVLPRHSSRADREASDLGVTPIRQGLTLAPKGPGGIVGTYKKIEPVAKPIGNASVTAIGSIKRIGSAPRSMLTLDGGGDFGGKPILTKKSVDPTGGYSPIALPPGDPQKAVSQVGPWTGGPPAKSVSASASVHRPTPAVHKPAPPPKRAQLPAKRVAGKR
jgi:hypothetical protein